MRKSRVYIIEFREASNKPWTIVVDYPSKQIQCYSARKDAVRNRQRMIYNSPYHKPTNIRVRKFVDEVKA